MRPLLEASELTVKAGNETVISRLSFQVLPGRCYAVLGRSGAGKTLLFKVIMGLHPYEGTLRLEGVEVRTMQRERLLRDVFFVPENPEDIFVMNEVANELAFILEERGLPPSTIDARIKEVLRIVGLERLKGEDVYALSGGEKRRLALAEALLVQAKLVLMDHPLADLDPHMKRDFGRLLGLIKSTGKAIIYTASRASDVACADEVIELRRSGASISSRAAGIPQLLSMLPGLRGRSPHRRKLKVDGVWFGYRRGRPVLRGVSFEAEAPGLVTILGRNGAGKTTLGKVIAGLLKPWKGSVSLDGKRPKDVKVAYVYQVPEDGFVGRTVLEDIALSFMASGRDKREAFLLASEVLRSVGLGDYAEVSVFQVERGVKKLISICSALALGPDIVILDEPTSGMDDEFVRTVRDLVLKLSEEALVIVTTHDIDLAKGLGGRAVLLRNGVAAYFGEARRVEEEML